MYYGQVRVQPLSYQDDVGSLCTSVSMLRKHARKITDMLKHKILVAHPDKSGYLLLGTQTYTDCMKQE
jgi:hypothetical protein